MSKLFKPEYITYALGGLLLVFTGYRTIDLVRQTMPTEAGLVALVAIAAFDGGVVAWPLYYNRGAKSNQQATVAILMTVLDYAGVAILFGCHTILNERLFVVGEEVRAATAVTAVVTIAVGVLANVGALLLAHLNDPDEILARARRDVDAAVQAEAVNQVRERTNEIAARVAPRMASEQLEMASGRTGKWKLTESKPAQVSAQTSIPQLPPPPPAKSVADSPAPAKRAHVATGRPRGRPRKDQTVQFAANAPDSVDTAR